MVPEPSPKRAQSKPQFHHHLYLRLRAIFVISRGPNQETIPHVVHLPLTLALSLSLSLALALFVAIRARPQIALETSDARNDGAALRAAHGAAAHALEAPGPEQIPVGQHALVSPRAAESARA